MSDLMWHRQGYCGYDVIIASMRRRGVLAFIHPAVLGFAVMLLLAPPNYAQYETPSHKR